MAFIGMVIAGIAVIIFIVILIIMLVLLVTAITLKIVGKNKNIKKMRTAGNVLLIIGIIFAVPVVLITGLLAFNSMYEQVTLPDESQKYILIQNITKMRELAEEGTDRSIEELDRLLEKEPDLVYYLDVNKKGVIDFGLEQGNAKLVETALAHGAEFDDPHRYENMAYFHNSMEYFIGSLSDRKITQDDVRIVELMFENNASTAYKDTPYQVYSSLFGKAVWAVLYNDGEVTDTELEFIQVFIDNGLGSDENLLLYDEKPSNVYFSGKYYDNVKQDENYSALMKIIGK